MEKFVIFVLGGLLTIFIIPLVEKRKSKYQKEEGFHELLAEIEDIKTLLSRHIEISFNCLHDLRCESNKIKFGLAPVPLPNKIETGFLIDMYKKSALILSSEQRLAVKRIPIDIDEINQACALINTEISLANINNIDALKQTIQLACLTLYDLNKFIQCKERYQIPSSDDYNGQTRNVLKTLGYTNSQIDVTRIDLVDLMIEEE
jgi:hypothetical protein